MLWLTRNTNPYQLEKCDISGELIAPGDWYYVDDVDRIKVKATVYKDLKNKQKEETWDYSKLNNASNEYEYRQKIKEATRQLLAETVLQRKVAIKYDPNEESEEIQEVYREINSARDRGEIK